jgi:hypothetical protein
MDVEVKITKPVTAGATLVRIVYANLANNVKEAIENNRKEISKILGRFIEELEKKIGDKLIKGDLTITLDDTTKKIKSLTLKNVIIYELREVERKDGTFLEFIIPQ